jgi:hypothetical protein
MYLRIDSSILLVPPSNITRVVPPASGRISAGAPGYPQQYSENFDFGPSLPSNICQTTAVIFSLPAKRQIAGKSLSPVGGRLFRNRQVQRVVCIIVIQRVAAGKIEIQNISYAFNL